MLEVEHQSDQWQWSQTAAAEWFIFITTILINYYLDWMDQKMFVILLLSLSLVVLAEKKQIYLAGTFPSGGSEGWQGGQACLPAAKLALEDVNRKDDILKDYHINLADKDDEVKTKVRS